MSSILKVSEIQDPTNGNTAVSIDSSGYAIMPQRPAFFARAATQYTQTGIIKYNDVTSTGCFNQGGHFSTTTYKFTAPVDGVYVFSNQVYTEGTNELSFTLYQNDVVVAGSRCNYTNAQNYLGISGSWTLYCDSGHEVYVSTGSTSHHTNSGYSYFSGHLAG
jgi:hypothetical protein